MSSKQRNGKKNKTTVLYEIKRNDSQKNIQMARSINIIALKTINRISSTSGQKRRLTENQPICRHSKRHQKLSLNLANSPIINIDDELKKQFANDQIVMDSNKKIDIVQTIDRMQRAELILVDNNSVRTDIQSFHRICGQFVKRIQDLQKENNEQSMSIQRYQMYFKQLSLKKYQQNQQQNSYEEGNKKQKQEKGDKNTQLKILNLQRKVQTLNYMVKNYRNNNKEEIRNFQKKINDFRPSLQNQLENLLTQANQKIKHLSAIIQYYQAQCEKQVKKGDWKTIVSSMKAKDDEIADLRKKIQDNGIQIELCRKKIQNLQNSVVKHQELKIQLANQKEQNKIILRRLKDCQDLKDEKQVQLSQLGREYEQLTFKYRGLSALEHKYQEKEQIISKNSLTILRLENQISSLRSKLSLALKSSQNQLFGKTSPSIVNIENCVNDIEALSSRFGEELDNFSVENHQLYSFMVHLFEKTKQCYEKIIEQYRQNLNNSQVQNRELKNRLDSMISCSKRKNQKGQQILQEIKLIDEKRERCLMAQNQIESHQDCTGCKCWLLNSGQINNACEQLQDYLKKYIEIV